MSLQLDTLDRVREWCALDGLALSDASGANGSGVHIDTDDIDVRANGDGLVISHRFAVRADAFSWVVTDIDEGGSTFEAMLSWVVDARWGPLNASSQRGDTGHDVVIECPIPADGMSHNAFTAARCEVIKTRHILDRILTDDEDRHESALARVPGGRAPEEQLAAPVVTAPPPPPVTAAPTPDAPAPWAPTHRVSAQGMSTWASPDPNSARGPQLDASLGVQVAERKGDWARVVCSNGWSAWVDARTLQPVSG